MLLGHLEQISVARPLEIKPIEVLEINKIKLDRNCNNNNDKCLPGVDLNHLPKDRLLKGQTLLTEEYDVFSKSENVIG